jgi:transcriptional regulator with XRE-family HTH domain
MPTMSLVRAGLVVRALRRRKGLRQADLAEGTGLSQQTISRIERGWFGALSIDDYCRVLEALGAGVDLVPRWRGPKLDALLDGRHARMQDLVAERLKAAGWQLRTEVTFSHFGERGAIDILAWRPELKALLILETKSELTSLEETFRTLDMKVRLAPRVVAPDLGWVADRSRVGAVLVLPEGSVSRGVVARHANLVDSILPGRNIDVRRWLAGPVGPLGAVWFVRTTQRGSATERRRPPDRPPDRMRLAKGAGLRRGAPE